MPRKSIVPHGSMVVRNYVWFLKPPQSFLRSITFVSCLIRKIWHRYCRHYDWLKDFFRWIHEIFLFVLWLKIRAFNLPISLSSLYYWKDCEQVLRVILSYLLQFFGLVFWEYYKLHQYLAINHVKRNCIIMAVKDFGDYLKFQFFISISVIIIF